MAKRTVSNTALGAAICRLIEQYQPEDTRLFDDLVIKDLVGAPIRWMMASAAIRRFTVKQTDAVAAGIYGAQVCRTRCIDEAVQAGLARGIDQVVILGAGYDTRPYRLPGIERATVFEVDLPAVQATKKKQLLNHFGRLPAQVTFIPIDFDTQPLEAALNGTAFDRSLPALFLWEGVTQYLTATGVGETLTFVGKSAAGSAVVFTYVLRSIIERRSAIPDANRMMDRVARQSPWTFGLDPAELRSYLRPFHLSLISDVGDADYQEGFLKTLGRGLTVFAGERIAQAAVD